MREMMLTAARVALLVYGGMLLLLAGCQRRFIYYPSQSSEADAIHHARISGLIPWRDSAGQIMGWKAARPPAEADAMLLFHGNAGSAVHRDYFVQGFAPYLAVHVMEYPGYGPRSGKPSEKAFMEAGQAALEQLRRERPGRIFLGGESLGTGVACRLAGANPERVSGVFLSTPFTSLADLARSHYPIFPVRWFLRDRFENVRHLQSYAGPVAILLAGRDEVVPVHLGRKLYESYEGPKRLWIQDDRSHNTLNYSPQLSLWREAAGFLMSPAP